MSFGLLPSTLLKTFLDTLYVITQLLLKKLLSDFMHNWALKSIKRESTRSLKIKEKVLFNITSEASYVYILNGQKLNKNAKNVHFGEFLKTWC